MSCKAQKIEQKHPQSQQIRNKSRMRIYGCVRLFSKGLGLKHFVKKMLLDEK